MINIFTGIKLLLIFGTSLSIGLKKANSGVDIETDRDFIEDMITVYASSSEEAQNKLPEGYSLVDDQALYSNSDGNGNTYIAAKTTSNYNDAITDIRAMNMIGGWSTSSYEELLEAKKEEIQTVYDAFIIGIEDFRSKFSSAIKLSLQGTETGTSYAALVFDSIYDEDIKSPNEDEEYATLLDIFINPSLCTKETLQTILLQGNSHAINSIFADLLYSAVALNPDGVGFDAKNLEDYEDLDDADGCDYFGPIDQTEIDQMVVNLGTVKETLKPFVKSGFVEHPELFTKDNIVAYMNCLTSDEAEEFQMSATMYYQLDGYTYLGEPLIDFFMNYDSDDENFDSACVKPFIVEMSDVERSLVPYSGFESLIKASLDKNTTYEDDDGVTHPQYNLYVKILRDNLASLKTKTSIFECVDRRLFTAEGIAMTSEALRQNMSKNDYDWYVDEDNERTALLNQIIKISAIVGGSIIGAMALMYYGYQAMYIIANSYTTYSLVFSQGTFWQACEFWAKESEELTYFSSEVVVTHTQTDPLRSAETVTGIKKYEYCYGSYGSGTGVKRNPYAIDQKMTVKNCKIWTKVFKVFRVATVVASISLAVALITYIVKEIIKYNTDYITYASIPEIMVSEDMDDNGNAYYSNYYNVKDVDGNIADVSKASIRKQSQWVALYYTKDKACGNPIYADSFYFIDDITMELEADGVKKFGEKSVYDVNKYTAREPNSSYICYESIDTLTYNKEKAIEQMENYGTTLMGTLLGKAKEVIETYTGKINECTSISDVREVLQEALKALNDEMANNYSIAYPIYQRIGQLGDSLDETEITSIREAYEDLTEDQKTYVENIFLLETAENNLVEKKFSEGKTSALKEIENYINSSNDLGTDSEKNDILYHCQKKISACTTIEEIETALDYCRTYVDNIANNNKNKTASIFGDGNLGLLFMGLGFGLIVGVGGLWITLRILKKRKEDNAA